MVPGSPFAAPANNSPTGMFVGGSESQGILYVALNAANQIAALSISGSGALTPLPGSPVAAGRSPEALLGSFNFLDAVNIIDHTISAYSMDQTTGALTEIQGSPYSVGTATAGIINGPRNLCPRSAFQQYFCLESGHEDGRSHGFAPLPISHQRGTSGTHDRRVPNPDAVRTLRPWDTPGPAFDSGISAEGRRSEAVVRIYFWREIHRPKAFGRPPSPQRTSTDTRSPSASPPGL